MKRLSYDIVMATRNRLAALRLSIPRMLDQSHKAVSLILVDSSDNHDHVRTEVEQIVGGAKVRLKIIRSDPGLPLQRNIGLRIVEAPIVMFPDDDSIWFPDTAESILRVYERDTARHIGGVCAAESPTPPHGMDGMRERHYRMARGDRLRQVFAHSRASIERRLFPDPFVLHGRSQWNVKPAPSWLLDEQSILVEWMTGFRMSFRTDCIRCRGFDEALKGYALFEDVEACYSVMHQFLVVGARKAKVFHYRFPGSRNHAIAAGASQMLNRAYVICRHSEKGSAARRRLLPYCSFKLLQYAIGSRDPYSLKRLIGAWRGFRSIRYLTEAPVESLPSVYARLRSEVL